jgi:hypothetical protein
MADIRENLLNSSSSYEYVRGLDASGNSIRIGKSALLASIPFSGSETKEGGINQLGWIRVAQGLRNNYIFGGIINIGNEYNNYLPNSAAFYFSGNGYGARNVAMIGKTGNLFTKVRIVYIPDSAKEIYLDVFYSSSTDNDIIVSLSSSLNARLIDIQHVEETIPAGYSEEVFVL